MKDVIINPARRKKFSYLFSLPLCTLDLLLHVPKWILIILIMQFQKYYPPDFDPSKIPKMKGSKNRRFSIRIMAPFNMR